MKAPKKQTEKPFEKFYKKQNSKPGTSRQFEEKDSSFRKKKGKSKPGTSKQFEEKGSPFEKKKERFKPGTSRKFEEKGSSFEKKKERFKPSTSRKFEEKGSSFEKKKERFKPGTSRQFEEKGSSFEKKKERSRPGTLRQFEEKDLSFGKKKESPKPVKDEQPEVTFSKELENKWETKPVKPPYGKHQKKSKDDTTHHQKKERNLRTKGFKKHFDYDEDQPEKVFDSSGSQKKIGTPKFHRKKNEEVQSSTEEMPLNKFIAHCGVCSRRDAVMLIKEGKVKVNGELIDEPGFKVTAKDKITLSGKKLELEEKKIYILLNKPKSYITTTDDPKKRKTVMDFFKYEIEERIYPVGRLDRNTTGLLLLTNDGDLSQKLAHPSNEVQKIYQVTLDKEVSQEDFDKIKEGLILEDGPVAVDDLAYLKSKNEIGIEIHLGRNRIVRRIFESLGYVVEKLDRVTYAGLTKKNVPRGHWRFLSKQEVINLKHLKK